MARDFRVGVLLAAGASSRMGRPKALLRDRSGRSFLGRLVQTLDKGGCEAVLVVGGCHVSEIARELPSGALLVHNAGWAQGQLSSAQLGLSTALSLSATQVVLHLVDQPLIQPADVRRVLSALATADLAIATRDGAPGHPIALSAKAAARIVRSRAKTLRLALDEAAPERVAVAGCSPGCLRGANTPAEARALLTGR